MNHTKGQAVVLAYLTILVISVLGSSLLNRSFSVNRTSQIQQSQANAFYLAEGGLEDAASKFATALANFQIAASATCYPDTNGDGVCAPNVATGTDVVRTTYSNGAVASSWIAQAEVNERTIVDPDGVTTLVKNFQVTSTMQDPTSSVTATLHQIIARRIIYTFQHAIFYDKDLEWLPGPDMTLTGRVHSNSDIYLGANSILTVDSEYLRTAGNLYNKRKDNGAAMPGVVQIKKAGTSPPQYPAMDGLDSASPTWTADSQTRWAGTVQTAVHGVTKKAVPIVGSTSPGGFYDTNATIKVVNGTIKKNGVALVEGTDIPVGTIKTTATFYNNREGKFIKMTEIDLKMLSGYKAGDASGSPSFPNQLPPNGLLYATRDDAPATQEPGIRLVSGSEIMRAGGVTVVSNDPVYVQGNFNTVSKKPVAVIADALNLLSTNWNDANSAKSLSYRTANNTTVNAAFIAGINTTVSGQYNGGLENYPRLHEKWSGKDLSITGSFVSLWSSQIGTGNWVYGNPQYEAPRRLWNYDTSFSSGSNMPPFTPWAVQVTRGAWWKD